LGQPGMIGTFCCLFAIFKHGQAAVSDEILKNPMFSLENAPDQKF
jgi:hypothetical protein